MRVHPAIAALFTSCLALSLHATEIASPAGPGSMGASLHRAADGAIRLSWLEPLDAKTWALKLSRLDAGAMRWSEARTVAQGDDWFVNWADFPSVTALDDRRLFAVWFVHNPEPAAGGHGHGAGYHAVCSLSRDGGATWSAPQPMTAGSRTTEFVAALPPGENGPALAAWLDGRDRAHNGGVQKLYAQTLLAGGADALVDPSVCDCCQLSLVAVPGGALLAYRGRTRDEVRDIRLARWRDGRWEAPRPLHSDGWQIAACPVNGPRLAADGARVAAVWFTGAQEQPRVQLKLSADGGDSFGAPLRLDLGRPAGRVDTLWLRDGLGVATWLELPARDGAHPGGIYLRTFSPDGALGEPRLLVASSDARAAGFLRLARLDRETLLAAYTVDHQPSRVENLLVRVQ